jgi:putative flippase GtrA
MIDNVEALPQPTAERPRLHAALRRPANWLQLLRFAIVGASGYAINLAVFAALVHAAGLDYRPASAVAFTVALGNNFVWNRRWTFRAGDGHAGFQAVRFLITSLVAFGFNLILLLGLVGLLGVADIPAQAIAIAAATPLNFAGSKLWSFKG